MTSSRLIRNSLAYHARSHAAVVLSVLVGSAVLTGALLVGDSMRGSLQAQALQRLAGVDCAVIAPRFFTQHLAELVRASAPGARPGILISAQLTHADSRARENRVTVIGLPANEAGPVAAPARGDGVVLNAELARRLGAKTGDEVIIAVAKAQVVPAESLLGRRDDLAMQFRLRVSNILAADATLGGLALSPGTQTPLNAFVDLAELQKRLRQDGRVNSILHFAADASQPGAGPAIATSLRRAATLADYDLSLRASVQRGYIALETRRILLEPPVERAARVAAGSMGLAAEPVLTYLINDLSRMDQAKGIPYSVATAMESVRGLTLTDGKPALPIGDGDLYINSWAADDLKARVGDVLRLRYFVSRPFGKLEESTTTLTLRGIVQMTGAAADPGLTPTYEGITTTNRLSEWDAPFPMDMKRIRQKDEDYWDKHRATPKAFVALATGRRLWAEADSQFGTLTSIHLYPTVSHPGDPSTQAANATPQPTADPASLAAQFERELLRRIDPAEMGLRVEDLRGRVESAAAGSTDFGMLFLGFSMFLIAAAFMLVVLVFRLGVERRAGEVGLLLALGFDVRAVSRLLLMEGSLLALLGVAGGTAAALGYAWLMLNGLQTWWALPGSGTFLSLHCDGFALLIGPVAGLVSAVAMIAWSIRGLARRTARSLMAGEMESPSAARGAASPWSARIAALCAAAACLVAMIGARGSSTAAPAAFFSAGALVLIAGLAGLRAWMRADSRRPIAPGPDALLRLGVRNARRHPGRSLLAGGLIACATFVVISVGLYRRDVAQSDFARSGGLGGFSLMAQSIAPIAEDLGNPRSRAAIGLAPETTQLLRGSSIHSFRVQPGEDASCENLYRVSRPRILGATDAMIGRGGFSFASHVDASPAERLNPWKLLHRTFDDGAIPVIADANTTMWLLKLSIGSDWPAIDERGLPVKLRLVATLAGSVLQGELIIAESHFKRLYPSIAGYSFFLIDVPPERAEQVESALEHDLSYLGFDAAHTAARLAAYLAIENTYLSTFQSLGGLGLVLGTIGLAAVMLRSVLERRRELALLRAVGMSRAKLRLLVLVENAALLAAGLLIGIAASAVAVGPQLATTAQQAAHAPWNQLLLTLVLCAGVGMIASTWAAGAATRAPLLASLRRD
ncbi:ABC transporter permease YtrF precursor [Phycisphaerae bacterium RAS2]|nr:ABC transporter permease YtrF precursor [Phycisphaerae bacterium RAS2]